MGRKTQWDGRRNGTEAVARVSLGVCSLGVPMSPELVNVRMWAHIDHGLISTERKHSQEDSRHSFLCIPAFQKAVKAHL
jgi:hypothetical protein